ncbi:hypothetical protein LDENG_00130350 [Lucifuga dentata]|nr:hypothetical protein LDENG_00130350 [Lucifuga dentata]
MGLSRDSTSACCRKKTQAPPPHLHSADAISAKDGEASGHVFSGVDSNNASTSISTSCVNLISPAGSHLSSASRASPWELSPSTAHSGGTPSAIDLLADFRSVSMGLRLRDGKTPSAVIPEDRFLPDNGNGICSVSHSARSDSASSVNDGASSSAPIKTIHDSTNIRDSTNTNDSMNIRDSTNTHDSTNIRDSTNIHGSTSIHNSTNTHDSTNIRDSMNIRDSTNTNDSMNTTDSTPLGKSASIDSQSDQHAVEPNASRQHNSLPVDSQHETPQKDFLVASAPPPNRNSWRSTDARSDSRSLR